MKRTPILKHAESSRGRKARASSSARPAAHAVAVTAAPVDNIRDAVSRLKRERIIATAVDLFYSNGFGNTTLDAVAQQLNVTKPFIYAHFGSKSDLLAEICSRGIRASLDVFNRVAASGGSPSDKIQMLVRDFMLAVIENQEHIAIYTREQKHLSPKDAEAINDMRREFDGKFHALLKEGVAAGEFLVDDAQIASLAIGGIVSWSYVWYRPNGRLTPAETAERISDLVLAMIQAKPGRRKRVRPAASAAA